MQTIDTTAQLLAALTRQNELLTQILHSLDRPQLGLSDTAPGSLKIYANRTNGGLWYVLRDGQPVILEAAALTGYLKELKFEETTRRGKQVYKLLTHIEGDRPYVIESGHDSHFSKGLLSAVARLNKGELRQPLTIEPRAADEETVLFCSCYLGNNYIYAPYSEDTNWREVSKQAIANVAALHQD